MNNYNNIPKTKLPNSSDSTVRAFDTYFSQPLELNANTLTAITGFFTGRGFEQTASESISVIIMKQAKSDGYNPMKILDTLNGLDNVEISALVGEILNYNRFKTSFLGYALQFTPHQEVSRNILA
jgi:hypothetical protein